MNNNFATRKELAEILKCDVSNISKMTRKGAFPKDSVLFIGGKRLFDVDLIIKEAKSPYNRRKAIAC
jgi:hypothetical protein